MNERIREYGVTGSAEAFGAVVLAHVDAVYSQCLRQLHDPGAAEDVTQQVFITLAQKAAKISPDVVLAGWLFAATRYCCANYQRGAVRRRAAERKAALMRNEVIESSAIFGESREPMNELLDDALAHLRQRDRDAVLLRFFQGRSLREVGDQLGVSEDAAKQRVSRAIEKLRGYFARRGVSAPTACVVAFMEGAIKTASPRVTQAAIHAAEAHAALATSAGWISKIMLAWPKFAAVSAVAVALGASVTIVSYYASAQTPAVQQAQTPAVADVPATQPFNQATPGDALNKLCWALETDDKAAIDECVCNDGKDKAQGDLGLAFVENTASVLRIGKAFQDKFAADVSVDGLNFNDFAGGSTYQLLYRNTMDTPGGPDMTMDGDIARVRVPTPADSFCGSGPDRPAPLGRWSGAMLVFNYVKGDWKLNTDRTFSFYVMLNRDAGNDLDENLVEAQIVRGVNETLERVALQVESGRFRSAPQAASAIKRGVGQAFQQAHVSGSTIATVPVMGG
jgi:RNA polymerase sigma factor (sigma-70 family)